MARVLENALRMHVMSQGRPPAILYHFRQPESRRLARRFSTAVSLHAHTWFSRESLEFLPACAARIPLVRVLADRELAGYLQRAGKVIHFERAFFRPPMRPAAVWQSEVAQIHTSLNLGALVSLTDHDSIKAGQILRAAGHDRCAPISFEWTVHSGGAQFHVGVHNLPAASANAVFRQLHAYTAAARTRTDLPAPDPAELLEWLGSVPGVLVVLNHPFWDLTNSGAAGHRVHLLAFLRAYGQRLHALEVNGFRTHDENLAVMELARECGLPVVSGGDRHGRSPNAVVNLTSARTFEAFAAEVREDRRSNILLMPAYRHVLRMRKLQSAAEILCDAPDQLPEHRHWTGRIFYSETGPSRSLCHHWPGGPPAWLRLLVSHVTRLPFGSASRLAGALTLRPQWRAEPELDAVLPPLVQPSHDAGT